MVGRYSLIFLLLCCDLGLLATTARRALAKPIPSYDETIARAEKQLAERRFAAGLETLGPLLAAYPQDHRVTLLAAWLAFNAGRYDEALRSYRRASALSGGARTAEAGVAWTLYRLGRRGEARARFLRLEQQQPGEALVAEGLRLTARPWQIAPSAALEAHGLPGLSAYGAFVGLGVRHDGLRIHAAYRLTRIAKKGSGSGRGRQASAGAELFQHEAHLTLGARYRWATLLGHYALVSDDGEIYGRAHLAGLTVGARFGRSVISLEGNVGVYQSDEVYRAVLSWQLHLGRAWLMPILALQRVDGATLPNGGLAAGLRWGRLDVALGGRYGEEQRAALLGYQLVYLTPDTIRYGGWASASLWLGPNVQASVTYALDRLADATPSAGAAPLAHHAALSLTYFIGRPQAKEPPWTSSRN